MKKRTKFNVLAAIVLSLIMSTGIAAALVNYRPATNVSIYIVAEEADERINNYIVAEEADERINNYTVAEEADEKTSNIIRLEIVLGTDLLEFVPEIPHSEYYAGVIAYYADSSLDVLSHLDVTWRSSDTNVFEVGINGAVRPTGSGIAVMTAAYDGVIAEKEITVIEASITRISTWPEELIMLVDAAGEIRYMPEVFVLAHTQGGNIHDITASHLLEFRSNDTNMIHPLEIEIYSTGNVSENQYTRSSARTHGETMLVASLESRGPRGRNLSTRLPVYVLGTENISEIIIDADFEILAGFGGTIQTFALLDNGMHIDITRLASWDTDNARVLSIMSGFIQEANPGDVTVTATFEGVSGSVSLRVESP